MTIKLENLVKKMKLEVINKSSDYSYSFCCAAAHP